MEEKHNLTDDIKQSFDNQEKFLLGFIQSEKIFKKYKVYIISLIALIIVGIIALIVSNNMKENDLIASNQAYANLLENPDDQIALKILETKNNNLFKIYQATLALNSNDIQFLEKAKTSLDKNFQDILEYKIANLKDGIKALENYSLKQDASLKEFAILQIAHKLIKEKKFIEAKDKLANIAVTSSLNSYAQLLKHFLSTKINTK